MSKHLHPSIESLLKNSFGFPEKILIGQLATVDPQGPWQRSLRVYGIEEGLGMIFLTHIGSRKWEELRIDKTLSLCLLNANWTVQISTRCRAQLLIREGREDLFQKYWNLVREDVRKTYLDKQEDLREPGSFFGMIAAEPNYWESLVLENDYAHSQRFKYEKTDKGIWKENKIPLYS